MIRTVQDRRGVLGYGVLPLAEGWVAVNDRAHLVGIYYPEKGQPVRLYLLRLLEPVALLMAGREVLALEAATGEPVALLAAVCEPVALAAAPVEPVRILAGTEDSEVRR